MPNTDLYDQDFYLWTQAQADALRAAGRRPGRSHAVEWERVAEEVEDVGKSQYQAAESLVLQILVHLFKLSATRRAEPKGHWKAEIVAFRTGLRRRLTPTMRKGIADDLTQLHDDAAEIARLSFESEEPESPMDASRVWSLPEILGEENDPLS